MERYALWEGGETTDHTDGHGWGMGIVSNDCLSYLPASDSEFSWHFKQQKKPIHYNPTIGFSLDPCPSVSIREIRGFHSSARLL